MNGRASETREHLEAEKRDLYAAIRRLEQDHREGLLDETSYRTARRRYELEAAQIVERLDRLTDNPPSADSAPPTLAHHHRRPLWIAAVALAVVAVAIGLLLVNAVHARAGLGSVTGDVPTVAPTTAPIPPAVLAAQRNAQAHPRSVDAQLALGNVYLNAGRLDLADSSYQQAMRLDPSRPEPPTLHAMIIGGKGQQVKALQLLRQVERTHPTYARAWLLEGLLLSHTKAGYPRAIAAWRRFLALQPHSTITPTVRQWVARLQAQEPANRQCPLTPHPPLPCWERGRS